MNDFATPAAADGVTWDELKGALLIIEPHSLETGIKTTFGDKDAIRADVTVIDGPNAGETHADTLIFPGVLISQTKPHIGKKVLGRLDQGTAKPGQKPPWKLLEATAADNTAAVAFLAKNTLTSAAPPF